jgi:hypothetical protein
MRADPLRFEWEENRGVSPISPLSTMRQPAPSVPMENFKEKLSAPKTSLRNSQPDPNYAARAAAGRREWNPLIKVLDISSR